MFDEITRNYLNFKIRRLRKSGKLMGSNVKLKNSFKINYVIANHKKLLHITLCVGDLPEFYEDKPFTCKDCDSKEVWKAAKQKHYFEIRKGKHLEALAIRCKKCRELINLKKNNQQDHMQNYMQKKQLHPNEMFFRNLEEFKKTNIAPP